MSLVQLKNNLCPVCYKDNLYCHYNSNKSNVEVFECGHFTCKECFLKIKLDFKCPICRHCGGEFKTLTDWCRGYQIALVKNPDRIYTSGFGKILGDLKDMYLFARENYLKKKAKKKKERLLEIKKQQKNISRQNAVCSLCNTKCTSIVQLKKHINSSNCKKKQRKLSLSTH